MNLGGGRRKHGVHLNKGTEKKEPYLRISAGKQRGRYVHQLVAEAKLGRRLAKGESVHHIDGDTTNNDWRNLEVLPISDHNRIEEARKKGLNGPKKGVDR